MLERKSIHLFLILLVLVAFSCQKKSEIEFGVPTQDLSIVNPSDLSMSNSIKLLSAYAQSPTRSQSNLLKINKNALGRLYLLSPSMIVSRNYPTLDLMAAKIIFFERVGDQIALMEKRFNAFYDDLGDDLLLQTFPISSEDAVSITFNWQYGLQFLSLKNQWVASDFPQDNSAVSDSSEPIFAVTDSLVRNASVKNGALRIEQISRFRGSQFQISLNNLVSSAATYISQQDTTIRLFFEIRPYKKNPNFKSKNSAFKDGIGYFENLVFSKGTADREIQSTYWDSSRPITYAITSSVPAEFLDAVKEGILYWNKVAGFPIIKIKVNVPPDQFPEDRTVLVHWAHWDSAGFARANMQHDPVTGEIIKGNVYMTSAFTRVESWIERLKQNSSINSHRHKRLGLNGLPSGTRCEYDLSQKIPQLQTKSFPKNLVKRMSQDLIREVIAHEVGHTLGLRHNYAASQDTEFNKFKEFLNARDSYIKNKLPKGAATSASVMDYSSGFAGAMLGAHIKSHALEYDEHAIDWAYGKSNPAKKSTHQFCSDGEFSRHLSIGCMLFDTGPELFAEPISNLKETRDSVMFNFFNSILLRVFPKNPDQAMEIEAAINQFVQTPLVNIAQMALRPLFTSLSNLIKGRQVLSINSRIGRPSWFNKEDYEKQSNDYLSKELGYVGGFGALIKAAIPHKNKIIQANWLQEQANDIIQSDVFIEGNTLDGVAYKLNSAQRKVMARFLRLAAEKFQPVYLAIVIASLTPDSEKKDGEPESKNGRNKRTYRKSLTSNWEDEIGRIALHIFESNGSAISIRKGAKHLNYQPSRYGFELRRRAIAWLDHEIFGKPPSFLRTPRKQAYASIKSRLAAIILESGSTSKMEIALEKLDLDADIYLELKQELELIKIFERNASWDL